VCESVTLKVNCVFFLHPSCEDIAWGDVKVWLYAFFTSVLKGVTSDTRSVRITPIYIEERSRHFCFILQKQMVTVKVISNRPEGSEWVEV
jgi:hypothetical protein